MDIVDKAIKSIEAKWRVQDKAEILTNPSIAGKYLKLQLSNKEREVFAVLFLDSRHRVLAYEELFFGTIDSAEVHPREIAKAALKLNAAAVILGHNHPSGNPEPSTADRALTARIKQGLALLEIRVLDHFVIGAGAPTSMAARGWV